MNTPARWRFPGPVSFSDDDLDQSCFFGRDSEKRTLLDMVLTASPVTLYGKSGHGKSSLLQAGLFPLLRESTFLPIPVRVNQPKLSVVATVLDYLANTAPALGIDVQWISDDDEGDENALAGEPGTRKDKSLLEVLQSLALWQNDILYTPVLVFDQFEELFTLHLSESRDAILSELTAVIWNRPIGIGSEPSSSSGQERSSSTVAETVPPKVVFCLREDYMADFDALAGQIPQLMTHRLRLLPFTASQARESIERPPQQEGLWKSPPFRFTKEAVTELLDFLKGENVAADNIEPFQVQVLCRHAEDVVVRQQDAGVQGGDVGPRVFGGSAGMLAIQENFYMSAIGQMPIGLRRIARTVCERILLNDKGQRLSLEEMDLCTRSKATPDLLAALENLHLVRKEPRLGSRYYEITHDTLARTMSSMRARSHGGVVKGLIVIFACVVAVGSAVAWWSHKEQAKGLELAKKEAEIAAKVAAAREEFSREQEEHEKKQQQILADEMAERFQQLTLEKERSEGLLNQIEAERKEAVQRQNAQEQRFQEQTRELAALLRPFVLPGTDFYKHLEAKDPGLLGQMFPEAQSIGAIVQELESQFKEYRNRWLKGEISGVITGLANLQSRSNLEASTQVAPVNMPLRQLDTRSRLFLARALRDIGKLGECEALLSVLGKPSAPDSPFLEVLYWCEAETLRGKLSEDREFSAEALHHYQESEVILNALRQQASPKRDAVLLWLESVASLASPIARQGDSIKLEEMAAKLAQAKLVAKQLVASGSEEREKDAANFMLAKLGLAEGYFLRVQKAPDSGAKARAAGEEALAVCAELPDSIMNPGDGVEVKVEIMRLCAGLLPPNDADALRLYRESVQSMAAYREGKEIPGRWVWRSAEALSLARLASLVTSAGERTSLAERASALYEGMAKDNQLLARHQPFVLEVKKLLSKKPAADPKFVSIAGSKARFGVSEVTVAEFAEFVSVTGYQPTSKNQYMEDGTWITGPGKVNWSNPGFPQDPSHPVVCVSWDDAMRYCQWRTGRDRAADKLPDSDYEYRLPKVAEYLAVTTQSAVPGKPYESALEGNYAREEVLSSIIGKWFERNKFKPLEGTPDGYPHTSPVKSFSNSRGGVFDLDGNASEWTYDGPLDAKEYAGESKYLGKKWCIGGGWHDADLESIKPLSKMAKDQGTGLIFGGFRLVLAPRETSGQGTR